MQVVPNQLIELHVDGPNGWQIYRSRVEDVYDDLVVVGAPIIQGSVVPLRVGTELFIEFKLRGALEEGRFRNRAILEKRFQANVPLLQLRLKDQWVKTQERMFVRVPVFIDLVFVALKEDSEATPQTGIMLNLSGGGFLLRADHDFELDEEIKVSFDLEHKQIVARALVARFVPTDEGVNYGFAFLELAEEVRKQIIRFVYRRQIELAAMARAKP